MNPLHLSAAEALQWRAEQLLGRTCFSLDAGGAPSFLQWRAEQLLGRTFALVGA